MKMARFEVDYLDANLLAQIQQYQCYLQYRRSSNLAHRYLLLINTTAPRRDWWCAFRSTLHKRTRYLMKCYVLDNGVHIHQYREEHWISDDCGPAQELFAAVLEPLVPGERYTLDLERFPYRVTDGRVDYMLSENERVRLLIEGSWKTAILRHDPDDMHYWLPGQRLDWLPGRELQGVSAKSAYETTPEIQHAWYFVDDTEKRFDVNTGIATMLTSRELLPTFRFCERSHPGVLMWPGGPLHHTSERKGQV
jgi:hypothetical protein